MSQICTNFIIFLGLTLTYFASSAVVEIKAIVPTTWGQIGINPVTIYGPVSQYVGEIGPNTNILVVENGQTKWIGHHPDFITEVPITTTISNGVYTVTSGVEISASKATTEAHGMVPGDVSITISPSLKEMLEDFAAEAVAECKLAVKVKRDRDVAIATEAFTQCINTKALEATRTGGPLESMIESADLESGALIPDVPPGPTAEFDALAAALQIARNQLRLRSAWVVSIILSTYVWTSTIYNLYRIPIDPTDVEPTITPTATPTGCPSDAPMGTNAPVCNDEDCQALPLFNKCSLGHWKGCSCIDTVYVEPQLYDYDWFEFQFDVWRQVAEAPDTLPPNCALSNETDFSGKPYWNPQVFCLCAEKPVSPSSRYATISQTTEPCAYTKLPPSTISVETLSVAHGGSVTSCRAASFTNGDGVHTSCTCNDNFGYDYRTPTIIGAETITDVGCDYITQGFGPTPTPTSTPPETAQTPTPSLPPSISVNLGQATCPRASKNPKAYMNQGLMRRAMNSYCSAWDTLPWRMGPGQSKGSYYQSFDLTDTNVGPLEKVTIHFKVEFLGGDNCPVLDVGGKDNSVLCKDIYTTIIDTCANDGGQIMGQRGGRFERDCYRWQVARCNIDDNTDCLFS
ncbi:hypothetical protein CC78DRAFT_582037 [Lojkania enalia]|uniref:Uncharacterized protein n=1 Tax=Lojkania enalia TaxID=147567 RepID=A0A9P4N2V7_9PLEO|nr:hypothetical protein CC78DRAFT_582037 [Didymosphaeria enalia]